MVLLTVCVTIIGLIISFFFWAMVDRFTKNRPRVRKFVYAAGLLYTAILFVREPAKVGWIIAMAVFLGCTLGYLHAKLQLRKIARLQKEAEEMYQLEDDRGDSWCSIHGYDTPDGHICTVAICYNPYRDGQVLQGTLEDRLAKASAKEKELWSRYGQESG